MASLSIFEAKFPQRKPLLLELPFLSFLVLAIARQAQLYLDLANYHTKLGVKPYIDCRIASEYNEHKKVPYPLVQLYPADQ